MKKYGINRRCPKCGGNLIIDRDYHGWYEQCLQCAFMHDLGVIYESRKRVAPTEKLNREKTAYTR